MSNIKSFKDLMKFLKANALFIGFLVVLIFVCYLKMPGAEFVSADDFAGYVNNPIIRNFGESVSSGNFYRVLYASLFKIFGLNAGALHTLAILVHVINTILVLTFTLLVFGRKEAVISALLFALHPVNTEAVAWFSGNGYLINAFLVFLSLNFYALYKKTEQIKYIWISLTIFSLGILVIKNAWILILPFLVAGLETFIFSKKIEKKNLKIPSAYFLVAALAFLTIFGPLASTRVTDLEQDYGLVQEQATPLFNRLPYTISMFFILITFPKDLSLFHEGEVITSAVYAMMVLFTISIPILLRIFYKKHRTEIGLIILMILSILPTMSPVQVSFFIAERYMYVSTAFFAILAALLILRVQKSSKNKHLFITLTLILCSIYGIRTFIRTGDWQNSRTLWEATSKVAVNSPRVYNNLGDGYAREGNYEQSILAFQKALALSPAYVEAAHNLANTYMQAGEYEQAEIFFNRALEINPNYEGADYAKKALEALRQRNP